MAKTRILFLGLRGACRSQIAQGFARTMVSAEQFEVASAALRTHDVDPRAIQVMAEIGIDIANQPCKSLEEVRSNCDLIIALAPEAQVSCSTLPGDPAVIRWKIPDCLSEEPEPSLARFRQVRDLLKQRIENLFTDGYLPVIVALKRNVELVLDHLTDGIIVHDTRRRITWFNQAAERITGYDRGDVIGRQCQDIFPGGFCGGKCSFAHGLPAFDKLHYPLKITTHDGHERVLDMTLVAMHNENAEFEGVLASIHDVTEVAHLRRQLKHVRSFHGIIGADATMQTVYELIGDLAVSDCNVIVQGESGTGKELVAGAIHGESRRTGRPFVTVNCGALPEGILESELFGHVRGAFTGAVRDKKGRFELADGGTLFLDEIGELSANMQVKLLRVLQEGTFERVGGEKSVRVDVRVISATNRDLRDMVRRGQFREDLFYRLSVVPVMLPPLRQRRNDIPLLATHFVESARQHIDRPVQGLSGEAMHYFLDYNWPGNIRELQNAIQYAFIKCKAGLIQPEHLPPEIAAYVASRPVAPVRRRGKLDPARVRNAIEQAKGNKVQAAKILNVGRATLYRFLREHPAP